MSDPIVIVSGLIMGLAFVWLGGVIAFRRPTEAEAEEDPASLSWARRPKVRRSLGLVIMVMGVLICIIRLTQVAR